VSVARTTLAGAGLLTVALLAGGCAAPSAGPAGSTAPGTAGSGTSQGTRTLLAVTVDDGAGHTHHWTLTCAPVGGTHPRPAAACAQLTSDGPDPFAPTPPDMMCSQIYGGPQTAAVDGTYQGRAVHATFSRTDGCAVARWQLVSQLLVVDGVG
jgi:hypothetical protein